MDQALWKNVFYQVIECFRQLLKDPTYDNAPHVRNMLLTLLDEVGSEWEFQAKEYPTIAIPVACNETAQMIERRKFC